ncbi:MAG TPA: tetratricopeptide repeat protein [Longimicrobiales bacterium]|nr:tetratricopeptide repeat protein [Longimicrobiales bacterium]
MTNTLRRRTLATMPIMAIAGAALGAAVGGSMLWFAIALSISSYVSAMLEAATIQVLRIDGEGVNGDIVAFVWDGVLGVVTGFFLGAVASADVLESAGAASALLFLQTLLVDKLILGNLVGDTFVGFIHGGSIAPVPEFSLAASMAARGDYQGARAVYEQEIARTPRDARAYIQYARMLRLEERKYPEAASVLRRALTHATVDARTKEVIMRELTDLEDR